MSESDSDTMAVTSEDTRRQGTIQRIRSVGPLLDSQLRLVGVTIFGAGIGKVASFGALTTYAWVANSADFGRFAAFWLAVQSVSGIFTSSAANATASEGALQGQTRPTIALRLPMRLAIRAGLFGMVVLPVAVRFLGGAQMQWKFVALGAFVGAITFTDALLGTFAGRGRSALVALFEAARGLLAVPAVLTFGLALGPVAAVTGLLFAEVVTGMGLIAAILRSKDAHIRDFGLSHSSSKMPPIARAGIFANLITQVGLYGFNAILSHGYGLAALAAFSIANRFASLAILLPAMLTKNMLGLLTRTAREDPEGYKRSLHRYIKHVTLLALVSGATAVIIATTFFAGLMHRYPIALPLLICIVVASIPSAIGNALGVACLVKGFLGTWVVSDIIFSATLIVWAYVCVRTNQPGALLGAGLVAAYLTGTAHRGHRVLSENTP